MLRRKLATRIIPLVLTCLYFGYWYYVGNGVVLTASRCPGDGELTIIVRKFPSTPPLVAHLISFFGYAARHRCELYVGGSRAFFSAHTYIKDSYNATNARVDWGNSWSATVYLDDKPVLAKDQSGFWTRVK